MKSFKIIFFSKRKTNNVRKRWKFCKIIKLVIKYKVFFSLNFPITHRPSRQYTNVSRHRVSESLVDIVEFSAKITVDTWFIYIFVHIHTIFWIALSKNSYSISTRRSPLLRLFFHKKVTVFYFQMKPQWSLFENCLCHKFFHDNISILSR